MGSYRWLLSPPPSQTSPWPWVLVRATTTSRRGSARSVRYLLATGRQPPPPSLRQLRSWRPGRRDAALHYLPHLHHQPHPRRAFFVRRQNHIPRRPDRRSDQTATADATPGSHIGRWAAGDWSTPLQASQTKN